MITFRTAHRHELDRLLDWAAAEGWDPGLDDATAFHAADPGGFFVAEQAGRPVAGISVVNHNNAQAFLGLYLCLPEYRGQGIGFGLWNHALQHAGRRCIGLDGVAAQEANYAKSGFQRQGATLRFQGLLAGESLPLAAASDIPRLIALDGQNRDAFLTAWLTNGPDRQTHVLPDGTGFCTARLCRSGMVKIGPVTTSTTAEAVQLIRAGAGAFGPSRPVIVDLPETNTALMATLQALGLRETFATARMYRGQPPAAPANAQAIATMELG